MKTTQEKIATLENKIRNIQAKIDHAQQISNQDRIIQQSITAAKQNRRQLLANQHLGKKVDMRGVDNEIRDAEAALALHRDEAEGADAAIELLKAEIDELVAKVGELRRTLPAMRYRAAVAQTEQLIANYKQSVINMETSLAQMAGSLMAIEDLNLSNPEAGLPICWGWGLPLDISLPQTRLIPALEDFQPFRSHLRVYELANAERVKFTKHLRQTGIV